MLKSIVFLALLFVSVKAFSCSCKAYDLEESFENHDVVVIGTVRRFGKRSFFETLFSRHLPEMKAVIRITKDFKKFDQEEITVYTNYSSAACGFDFKEGVEYALFAYSPKEGYEKDKYFVDSCSPTIHTQPREDYYEQERKRVVEFLSGKSST